VNLTVKKTFSLAKCGVGVNFLSSMSQRKDGVSYYCNPASCVKLLMKITPFVVLRHDYRQNDFTIYLYRKMEH
jgi:hypothetical protein